MTKFVVYLLTALLFWQCTDSDKDGDQGTEIDKEKDPISFLMAGNKRYMAGKPQHPDQTIEKIKELNNGQKPFAVVVACSDSRVSPELVFDQGLGDLFVIRTAGNVIGDLELGSIEYAVEHLESTVIIVMGHEKCGAITAFCEHKHENNHIENILKYIENEEEEKALNQRDGHFIENAIKANVLHGVNVLTNSHPIVNEYIKQGKVKVYGAVYQLSDGKVKFINTAKK